MRAIAALICGMLAVGLAACESPREASWSADPEYTGSITPTLEEPGDVKYYRSDEPLRLGLEHFNRGAFGTAERYFRDAVEKSPEDLTAWVGLAASYDRTGRFDLADKAYGVARRIGGESVQLLNNLGYSYMLRGDLPQARAKFEAAQALDPDNATIINNIELLHASYRYIQRNPDAEN